MSTSVDPPARPASRDLTPPEVLTHEEFERRSTTYRYSMCRGIKIYDGTSEETHRETLQRIEYWKREVRRYQKTDSGALERNLFTPMKCSTNTVQGRISGVSFNEEDLIKKIPECPPPKNILSAVCNFGKYMQPGYEPPKKVNKSGRGRKPKPKKLTKRRTQGNGNSFNSQITFLVRCPEQEGRQYHIKLFRSGVFLVPYVRDPSLEDLVPSILILRDYIQNFFEDPIKVQMFYAVMRNYKCTIADPHLKVNLPKMVQNIKREKRPDNTQEFVSQMTKVYSKETQQRFLELLCSYNPMRVAEISYNPERCIYLMVKVQHYRLLSGKEGKTTMKLLTGGKINFDSANNGLEALELYYWAMYVYLKYRETSLVDERSIKNEYPDTSDDDEEPIYEGGGSQGGAEVTAISSIRSVLKKKPPKIKPKLRTIKPRGSSPAILRHKEVLAATSKPPKATKTTKATKSTKTASKPPKSTKTASKPPKAIKTAKTPKTTKATRSVSKPPKATTVGRFRYYADATKK